MLPGIQSSMLLAVGVTAEVDIGPAVGEGGDSNPGDELLWFFPERWKRRRNVDRRGGGGFLSGGGATGSELTMGDSAGPNTFLCKEVLAAALPLLGGVASGIRAPLTPPPPPPPPPPMLRPLLPKLPTPDVR